MITFTKTTMKFDTMLTTTENIANLLLDVKHTSDVAVLEQTICYQHCKGEMSFYQRTTLEQACKDKRNEFAA